MTTSEHNWTPTSRSVRVPDFKALRVRCGASVNKLAQLSGTSRTTITKLESGEPIRTEVVVRLFSELTKFQPILQDEIRSRLATATGITERQPSVVTTEMSPNDNLNHSIAVLENIVENSSGKVTNSTLIIAHTKLNKLLDQVSMVLSIRRRNSIEIDDDDVRQ